MALSESKKKDLEDKDFHTLFADHKHHEKWRALAKKAYAYAKDNITNGKEPRPDDVSKALIPILEAEQALRDHQNNNGAKAKKYREWFAEYIVDQVLVKHNEEKHK